MMANSTLLFDFEHINEDQLWDIIERVKRDKRRRRESADWLAYSSRKKEEIRCKTDISGSNLSDNVHRDQKFMQLPLKARLQKCVDVQETMDYLQIVRQRGDNHVQVVDDTQEIRHILQKMCSIRQSISGMLDSILSQSELKMLKKNIFRGGPIKFEESESIKRLMNYRCRILRLDYQLVMDMRKLSRKIAKNDLFLDALSKCHSTASKLLQVFVRGWHGLMEMNQMGEKFCDLLKSVIILSRVCKTICIKIRGLTVLDDFMIDVLNKKCNAILHDIDKEYNEESQEKKSINADEEMKKIECSSKKHQSTKYIDLMKADPVSIPIKTFKKLAEKHFDGLETRMMHGKNAKVLSQGDYSRPTMRSATEICQVKKAKHSSNLICKKASVNASEKNGKPCSSSSNQDVSCLESEMKNFDMESFSKKLYTTLEKEICTNMRCIFNNLSLGQLQIYQTAGQNNDQHLFYNDKHLEILGKLKKSLHISKLEEIPLEIEFGGLHGKKEVLEADIDNPKENEDSLFSKNEEGGYKLSGDRPNHALQLTATPHHCKIITSKPYEICEEKSSGKEKFVGGEEKLLTATERVSARGLEPWDAIGSISEKLIAECLKSISSQLDYCILQNIFDQEFL